MKVNGRTVEVELFTSGQELRKSIQNIRSGTYHRLEWLMVHRFLAVTHLFQR